MPGGDRTGPAGLGPRTGRARGFCGGYATPGFMDPAPGRGAFGRGRGWRHWFFATGLTGRERTAMPSPAPGLDPATREAGRLEAVLEEILRRLTGLETAARQERSQ